MEIETFDIEGLFLLKPRVFGDQRGYFVETFNEKTFQSITKLDIRFVQDNESQSNYGVLRGLHFQRPPFAQSKLVRAIKGKVLDVAVDLRAESPTFGGYVAVELTDENKHQLFVPRGFAHAFVVLSEVAIFAYKVDNWYAPTHDDGILFNDATLNIDWRVSPDQIQLSAKDKALKTFEEYQKSPTFTK